MRRLGRIGLVAAAALLIAGCYVNVRHVSDAGPAFAEARREAAELKGQSGRPETLNILAYDPDDKELVRVQVPMWMAEKIGENGDVEVELDGEDRERMRRHLERDLRLEDLQKAGYGVLVEVHEDGGERVLIWLS
jgi:hypothetical protein